MKDGFDEFLVIVARGKVWRLPRFKRSKLTKGKAYGKNKTK